MMLPQGMIHGMDHGLRRWMVRVRQCVGSAQPHSVGRQSRIPRPAVSSGVAHWIVRSVVAGYLRM